MEISPKSGDYALTGCFAKVAATDLPGRRPARRAGLIPVAEGRLRMPKAVAAISIAECIRYF